MELYPPIYQTSLGTPRDLNTLIALKSQGFGENVAYYQQNIGTNGHAGIDWPCADGTPVYASHDGTVKTLATDFRVGTGTGAGVILSCSEGESLYWHLKSILVSVGQNIKRGDKIGYSDNSGFSTGPHLHLEWRPYPLQSNNGFYGAVDPAPLLRWQTLPASKVMTSDEVKKVYVLAFYREPDPRELQFWTGKTLIEFLNTAIKDRAAFLHVHE